MLFYTKVFLKENDGDEKRKELRDFVKAVSIVFLEKVHQSLRKEVGQNSGSTGTASFFLM